MPDGEKCVKEMWDFFHLELEPQLPSEEKDYEADEPPLLISQPTIVMDAGIASEENLRMVKESGFSYIVVSRGRTEPMEEDSFDELQPGIRVKEMRIEGHLFISILAYHLLRYIQQRLRKADIHHRWATVRSFLQTHIANRAYLPTTDAKMIHLRHCAIPTPKQAEIYGAMGIAGMPFKSVKIEM